MNFKRFRRRLFFRLCWFIANVRVALFDPLVWRARLVGWRVRLTRTHITLRKITVTLIKLFTL